MTPNYSTDGEYTGWTRYTSGVDLHPSEHGPCEEEGRTAGSVGLPVAVEKSIPNPYGLGMVWASRYLYAVMGAACVSGGRDRASYYQ